MEEIEASAIAAAVAAVAAAQPSDDATPDSANAAAAAEVAAALAAAAVAAPQPIEAIEGVMEDDLSAEVMPLEEPADPEVQAAEAALSAAAAAAAAAEEGSEAIEAEAAESAATDPATSASVAAAAAGGVARPAAAVAAELDDNAEDSDPEMDEETQEAVEGVLRLKRLLSRDFEEDERLKKRLRSDLDARSAAQDMKVSQLLNKWGLGGDSLTRHVLENLTVEELQNLITSNYSPDTHNMWKSPAELLQTHTNQVREARGPGGGPLDVVSAFKYRHRLDTSQDRLLRGLMHKELRYVLNTFDGSKPLEEVIADAKSHEQPEEELTVAVLPDGAGVQLVGRFTRLELIDPMGAAAVFGDANLTFSLNLVRHRKALGHVGRVIATTFENLETLQERYKEIDDTIVKLEEHFAEVHHGVDCTRIAMDDRFKGLQKDLDAVYYNYPHAGAVGGFFDGHPVVNWRHENLMRLFFRALRSCMRPGGVVKVASNAGAVGVRFSYIMSSAMQNEFEHIETMPFQQWQLHRYGRSYGDRRDTYKRPGEGEQYNAQRADSDMVYCFAYKPSGAPLARQQIRMPPTYRTMLGCTDGALGERQGESKKKLATELYKRFMQECSGVHVG